jgi:hypothetical protein
MAVPITRTPKFDLGLLFDVRLAATNFPYDVASDGRFLMSKLDASSADPSARMTVVLNWARR